MGEPPSPILDMPDSGPVPQGTRLADRFAIERTLGRGAFGRTLLARDARDGALRTLKLLDPTNDRIPVLFIAGDPYDSVISIAG